MENKKLSRTILENVVITLVAFVLGLALPALALFFFGGYEIADYIQKVQFYYALGIFSLVALIMLSVGEYLASTNKKIYERWGWMKAITYDPDMSIVSEIKFVRNILSRPFLLANIGIIIFLIIGIFSVVTNTFFASSPEQQVTETGTLVIATEPAASAETLFFAVIASLMLGAIKWYGAIKGLGKGFYIFMGLFGFCPAFTLSWIAYHYVRYGAQESKLLATASFGLGGALLILITGTVLLWYIWHFFNNLLQKANELFSSDIVAIVVVVAVIVYIFVNVFIWLRSRDKSLINARVDVGS